MVCSKCQKIQAKTELATPGVKRKNDIYYGSPALGSKDTKSKSTTLGGSGIGKSKLLSKGAKNPYSAYSSSCSTCKIKTEQGRKFCHRCAYKANVCAMCGKSQNKDHPNGSAQIVQGQKFSAK